MRVCACTVPEYMITFNVTAIIERVVLFPLLKWGSEWIRHMPKSTQLGSGARAGTCCPNLEFLNPFSFPILKASES